MRLFLIVAFIISGLINPLIAQSQSGIASVRPLAHEGTYTQTGRIFSHDSLVASHRTIPFGSMVKVTNLKNRKSVDVVINDRGPFINGHIIDLSEIAAQQIGLSRNSLTNVRVDVLKLEDNYTYVDFDLSDSDGKFTIKVASFGDKNNAMNYANNLRSVYEIDNIFIESDRINNRELFRVFLGNFMSREMAEQYLKQLSPSLDNAYVTTIKE